MTRVLIVGGGFAGLNAAKVFGRHGGVDVTLIDRHNYHLFQPLLYQVATAGLSPADIAAPIRSMLSRYPNITVLLGEVRRVDLDRNVAGTSQGCPANLRAGDPDQDVPPLLPGRNDGKDAGLGGRRV